MRGIRRIKKLNFDYQNYKLVGEFKKEIYREDYFWLWKFLIYQNKLIILLTADIDDDVLKPFPNGQFILTTYNNSKIKIKVKDGTVEKFELLSSVNKFKEKEERIKKMIIVKFNLILLYLIGFTIITQMQNI